MGNRKGAYRVLVWKPERRRQFGRFRHKWKDNIKMDLKEVTWGMAKIDVVHDWGQVADSFECGDKTSDFIKCREFLY
jgi:hypothetical protein